MIRSGSEEVAVMARRAPQEELINLPPGFRFNPTDQELMLHYLNKKAASLPFQVPIIQELDLYKFNPWELPDKALFGEKEWYFFTPRDRKYPNGHRPNRAAGCGYWKATGVDKPIFETTDGFQKLGVKKSLVFYKGKPPKGVKTNWIMHEYRLPESATSSCNHNNMDDGNSRLEGWVLCRIYCKKSSTSTGKTGRHLEITGTTAAVRGMKEDSSFCSLDSDEGSHVGDSMNEDIMLSSSFDISEFPWDDNLLATLSSSYPLPLLTTTLDFHGSPSAFLASLKGSDGNM